MAMCSKPKPTQLNAASSSESTLSSPALPSPLGSPQYGGFQFGHAHSHSDAASISTRSSRNMRNAFDDIKHEVMVNHLYQQQCSRLWVSDGCGEIEGVLLRKSRGHYLSCPPGLRSSQFAKVTAELNLPVCRDITTDMSS
jgi:hypothetical protein